MTDQNGDEAGESGERIDKWLWAARFFKTRSLAAEAVGNGKVEINGARVKRSKAVAPGDRVSVRSGPFTTVVVVRATAKRRGSAKEAALLYEETPESRRAREVVKSQLTTLPRRDPGQGRPSKKERRQLRELRDDWG